MVEADKQFVNKNIFNWTVRLSQHQGIVTSVPSLLQFTLPCGSSSYLPILLFKNLFVALFETVFFLKSQLTMLVCNFKMMKRLNQPVLRVQRNYVCSDLAEKSTDGFS